MPVNGENDAGETSSPPTPAVARSLQESELLAPSRSSSPTFKERQKAYVEATLKSPLPPLKPRRWFHSVDISASSSHSESSSDSSEGGLRSSSSGRRFSSAADVVVGQVSGGEAISRTDFDDSTHSISSVRELRDNILSQNPQVPPAFQQSIIDRSPSPKGRSSYHSDTESPQKRRSRRPPPRPMSATSPRHHADGPLFESSFPKIVSPSSSHPPRPPIRKVSNERRPPRSLLSSSPSDQQSPSGRLRVNLISIESLAGDKSNVSTYNAMLESIANSDNPTTQKGLDMLATMEQNGVTPDETTWKLLDRCSRLRDESDGEQEQDESLAGSGRRLQKSPTHAKEDEDGSIMRFSLFATTDKSSAPASSVDLSKEQAKERPRKARRMEQDLSQLPPAFRTSILAMLRRKGLTDPPPAGNELDMHSTIRKLPPAPPLDRKPPSEPTTTTLKAISLVSDQTNSLLPKDLTTESSVSPASNPPLTQEIPAGASASKNFSKLFAEHGVVQYLRPDGLGKAARNKGVPAGASGNKNDDSSTNFLKSLEAIDNSSDAFTKLLSSIAGSDLPDRANLAGKVLKRMKSTSMTIDKETLALLVACTRIPDAPKEPKPQELVMVDEVVVPSEVSEEDAFTTPTQLIKKRVRFAATNSFRFIRRRRSIGSNERWDDPLTPPKRLTEPVDLAPARFSSGLRDDRPSLPRRRFNAGSSHSISSRSLSSSGSDTIDSLFDEDSPLAEKFKLPFAEDSPAPASAPEPNLPQVMVKTPKEAPGPPTATIIAKTDRHGIPAAPVRSNSNDDTILLSPQATSSRTQANRHDSLLVPASIPPPPLDDSTMYRTPSPQPRLLRRRRSISGIERRVDIPLTPPRRVSAPLELFIAQEALEAKLKAKLKAESAKCEEQTIVKAMELTSIGTITTPAPISRSSPVKLPRDRNYYVSKQDSQKPPLPTSPMKTQRRNSSTANANTNDNNPARQIPLPLKSTPTPTKTIQNVSEVRFSRHELKVQSGHLAPPKESLSPLVRHKEKMSELWKRMEFSESVDGDSSSVVAAGRWNFVDVEREEPIKPPAYHNERQQSPTRRIRPRLAQRQQLSTSTFKSKPKTKPSEAPSWQRVLRGSSQGAESRKSKSIDTSISRRVHAANNSHRGTRTFLINEPERSDKDTIDAYPHRSDSTPRQDAIKRRATRRNSMA